MFLSASLITLSAGKPGHEVEVSWDFGSGPGKTSNFYVGERRVPVQYSSAECLARFSLERVRYEYAQIEKGGRLVPEGAPFVMLTLRKQFKGDFELVPKVTIRQNKVVKRGESTGKHEKKVFPFREKFMAAPVEDWSAADIEVSMGAPGAIMDLNNPMDWQRIDIECN